MRHENEPAQNLTTTEKITVAVSPIYGIASGAFIGVLATFNKVDIEKTLTVAATTGITTGTLLLISTAAVILNERRIRIKASKQNTVRQIEYSE